MALRKKSGFRGGKRRSLPQDDSHRINRFIKAREVRVISDSGEQLGILSTEDALAQAESADLDLVEVSPNADPPVCKFLDYGKFKYKEQKKEAEARKKRSETQTKEIRVRYRTDIGDLETKLKQARDFLEKGDKVKFSMRFRGREIVYQDLGMEKFNSVIEALSDLAVVDERSRMPGRQIYIILAPAK
ncbi:translation initiation factor IF-3 [Oligoflexia bacterium]|nr:translation initiation factor IF-3 [Oligoflexia bacterium]